MKEYKGLNVPTARRPDTPKALWEIVKDNRDALCYGSFDCSALGCKSCIFSKQNYELRYEYLKSIFEEEGEKKMFDYNLWPGAIVETVFGEFYMYVTDDKIYHLITVKSDIVLNSPCCRLTELADEITNVYNPNYIPDIYQVIHDIEDARNQFNVWTKEACIELTMEELEQRLGIKVKIVKEHK